MKSNVSVIVCTRDRKQHVEKCILSLLNQSYKPKEIIIVDDASKEEIDIIKLLENASSLLVKKQRINRYVDVILLRNKKRQGIVKSRNIGVSASSGDIIAFIDDDGHAHKSWIKNLIKNYSDGIVGVGGPVVERSRSKKIVGKRLSYITLEGEVKHNYRVRSLQECKKLSKQNVKFLMGGNMSFRKDILLKVGGGDSIFKGNYYREETDLCMRISKRGKLVFEPKATIFHNTANEGGTRDISTIGSFLYWYFRNSTLLLLRNYPQFSSRIFRHAKSYITRIKGGESVTNRGYLKMESERKTILSIFNGIASGFIHGFFNRKKLPQLHYKKPKYVLAVRVRFLGDRFAIIRQEGILKSVETLIRI